MKLLVCGGRNYSDKGELWSVLDEYLAVHGDRLIIIHGACPTGADDLADKWAQAREVDCLRVPARWNSTTPVRAAGPLRNKRMIERYRPQAVLATVGGTGTAGMCDLAKSAGLTPRILPG